MERETQAAAGALSLHARHRCTILLLGAVHSTLRTRELLWAFSWHSCAEESKADRSGKLELSA